MDGGNLAEGCIGLRRKANVMTQVLLFENGANWRWAVGQAIADPAVWLGDAEGRGTALVSELEVALLRAHADPARTEVVGYAAAQAALGSRFGLASAAVWLMQQKGVREVVVPRDFVVGLWETLQPLAAEAGIVLRVAEGNLVFPARAIKTEAELTALRAVQRLNGQAMQLARSMLAEAEVAKDGTLVRGGVPLTSAMVRGAMNGFLLQHGCEAFGGGPIVTCGAEAALPHARGEGVLRAGELIVIDTFPQGKDGFWGDLTRTFVKGQPTAWQRDVVAAVRGAQELALGMLAPGVDGAAVHAAVAKHLTEAGFATGVDEQGNPYGFFHGTGHGVGLELHEPGLRMLSKVSNTLAVGMVTSVEPGLYYAKPLTAGGVPSGVGGCRIEDLGVVTADGFAVFAAAPKDDWAID